MGGGRQIDEHVQQRTAGQTGGFTGMEPDVHFFTYQNVGVGASNDGFAFGRGNNPERRDQKSTLLED